MVTNLEPKTHNQSRRNWSKNYSQADYTEEIDQ